MKISIAMATYNGEKFIEEQLQSFVDQTIKPDEIVISDDKSTDNTLEIIDQFIKKAPFKIIVIINSENLGYAGNFNSALSNTTGDIVFMSDQDDVWYSNKIEQMIDVIKENPSNLVYMNDAMLADSNLNPINLTKYGQIKSAGLVDENFIMGCCCVVRRELLNLCLPIPSNLKGHDDWIVGIADGISKKYIHKTVLQLYRRHGSNESSFIPNKLKKVTIKDIWLNRLNKDFLNKENRTNEAIKFMEQTKIFYNGLLNIKNNVPTSYTNSFDVFLNCKKKELELLELRYSLRKEVLILRIIKAVYFYFFIYDKKTRTQNIVRDIFS